MKKFYVSNLDELNDQEKKTGCVSYRRVIDRYISDLVLCNKIEEIEEFGLFLNKEEYYNEEIYQYYLCNLTEYEREKLEEYGIILSYSHKLDLDVLCVEHLGTSWDYVMTDVKWTDNINED